MLVDELIQEVRRLSDEDNTSDIGDADIIASLNRAQQKLVRMAVRKYEPMFMGEVSSSSFSGRELTIPELAIASTISTVDVIEGNNTYRVMIAPIRTLTELENTATTSRPSHYAIKGTKILLYPTPSAGTIIRVRYQVRPPNLVISQGRITTIDDANTTIYVDSLGDDLTTSIANLKAFVNIVDSTTGLVKGTLQVSNITTAQNKIAFKTSSLDRTTVFGSTVDSALPTDIALDDYICLAEGTCVPTLSIDFTDFLVQYSVVETLNRLGIPAQEAYARLKELQDDVDSMWTGRPKSKQIKQANRHWMR